MNKDMRNATNIEQYRIDKARIAGMKQGWAIVGTVPMPIIGHNVHLRNIKEYCHNENMTVHDGESITEDNFSAAYHALCWDEELQRRKDNLYLNALSVICNVMDDNISRRCEYLYNVYKKSLLSIVKTKLRIMGKPI